MRDGGNPEAHPAPDVGEDRFAQRNACRFARGLRLAVLSAAAVVVAMVAGAPAPAEAHGRLGAAEGRCRLFIGPDIMNFTGYLPEASKNEFSQTFPPPGRLSWFSTRSRKSCAT